MFLVYLELNFEIFDLGGSVFRAMIDSVEVW